jgi:hypothetical protein
MKYNPLHIVLLAFAPLAFRTALYWLACKIRSVHITVLRCIILAGSGVLLAVIPIPLPGVLAKVLAIGVAMFLMTRYTEAELYPDVVLIPIAVEILSSLISEFLIAPLAA